MAGNIHAQIVINEVCLLNGNGKIDEDAELSDWIELYNNLHQSLIFRDTRFRMVSKNGYFWLLI